MKLLTLNTHSIIEDNYEEKISVFVNAIVDIKPDIFALQEVNQTACKDRKNISIGPDNHAQRVSTLLRQKGLFYNWLWLPIKNGYDRFDEGIAVFSLSPIKDKKIITLSQKDDYNNWRTRKALGIKNSFNEWFYSVHFGWWDDKEEPFITQWQTFESNINKDEDIWVLGDFNADYKSNSYEYVMKKGWYDSYILAEKKDDGFTVDGRIAGWENDCSKKRIDYIITNRKRTIKSSNVIFNGKNYPVVSDHYGVIVKI